MALIDRQKLADKANQRLDAATRRRPAGKAAYQKYFDGYTTYTVRKKNGKGVKTLRIYTADYYVHDCDDKKWLAYKLSFAGLSLLALALYLAAALGGAGSAFWPPVAVPGCVAMAGFVMYLAYLICYLLSPRRMTVWTQTHYHKLLLTFALILWVSLAVTAVFCLAFVLFVAKEGYVAELLTMAAYALSAASLWYVSTTEKNMDYCTEYNDAQTPDADEMVIN